jgi:ABC-type bacteriocin/lantibiotic exporter with double-glycine peptidase domain
MGLLIIGSILVMEQQMNIGQFVAAEIIIILIMNSVEKLVLSLETIYDVLTSLEKIGQVTDLELEDQDGMEIVQKEDNGMSVEMKDVTFTYPGSINPVVENVSFRIEKGQKLLITGKNNSGKSTLLYLLAGIYKLKQGSISYNDIPIGNYNPESLRSFIGDCLMEEMLFEGSILDNIAMGRERATFENVQWAIKNLGLSDFIKSLPEGYNTVIHPQGQQFSQGVIDKLILARCIADRPHVLLIKDAFRLFEKEERIKILNFLSDKKHGWTLIIASANPELEFQPDQIVDLTN